MRAIQCGRGFGKTTQIVRQWQQHGKGYLVVATVCERSRIIELYRLTMNEQERVMVSGPNVLKGIHAEVFVDNADWVLSMYLGAAPDVASFNEGEY